MISPPSDTAEFGFEGRDDDLEGTLADMLTVLNGKAVDHGCLLFVRRILVAIDSTCTITRPGASYHVNI